MKPQWGSEELTKIMDDEGSTMTTSVDYKNGQPKVPMRRHYKIRLRVYSRQEERDKYHEFSKELEDNPHMLDAGWHIENSLDGKTGGYYYVIKSYTELCY